jgi:predicted amidohydrolase YtcJ
VTLVAANAEDEGKADVVLRNGKIYADPARSIKQAIAFSGNTILAVGEMRKWIS